MQELFFLSIGDGEPVVFIHGFCESKSIWEDFSKALSPYFRVISLDLPGFGSSAYLHDTPPSIDSYAQSVVETLKSIGVRKAVLVGHSLGAYVAINIAKNNPNLVAGLCLFHSTCFADSEEKKVNRMKVIDFVKQHGTLEFVKTLFPTLFAEHLLPNYYNWIEAQLLEARHISPHAIEYALLAMKNRPDERETLKKITCSVLFIIGKQDRAVSLSDSLDQVHIPAQSHALFLDDCGHMGMIEHKQTSLKAIYAWLNTIYKFLGT